MAAFGGSVCAFSLTSSPVSLPHHRPFTALAGLPLLLGTRPVRADELTFYVTDSRWGSSPDRGTFAYAVAQSNANPGRDTISITPGLLINVDAAAVTGDWLTTITENLTIEGNGATLVGNPTSQGTNQPIQAYSFAKLA